METVFQVSRFVKGRLGRARGSFLALGFLLALLSPHAGLAAATNETPKAQLKVSGYGLMGNHDARRTLKTLELGRRKFPEFFGPAQIEDCALVLTARVRRDGYLHPVIDVLMELEDGSRMQVRADELQENPLPRPLRARKLHFHIRKGVRYYFKELKFEGLTLLTEKQAAAYFIEIGTLLRLKGTRIYTPQQLDRGLASLREILERNGYEEAKVSVADLQRDDPTGAVKVRIVVQQGPKVMVRSVREEFFYGTATEPAEMRTVQPNRPFSKLWLQDFRQSIRSNLYHRGYPDTSVEVRTLKRDPRAGEVDLELLATVKAGAQVWLKDVSFEGHKKTSQKVLERRVRIREGGLLDRIEVEEGRNRLARFGIFNNVDLEYEPIDEQNRSVTYRVEEGKNLEFNLLVGYGSYELLRGGFEVEKYNIWGRAHHARLKAVQSFKASTAEFTYTVPELIPEDVDLFLNGSGLRREEVDFTREEYGGGAGVHKYFKNYATDVSLRYNYQILRAVDVDSDVATEGLTNTSVGAVIFDVKHDRRDNPLYPRRGYKIFGSLELASEYLAGDVNYQRLDLWTAWHRPLGGGRWLSLGLSHGVLLSFGSSIDELPFNKRFFPGGENSIRGYKEGEASPRNADGDFVGSETYTLATVEFEQALTPKWAVVFFSDSLGFAREASDYPFDTGLFSVGGGLRWKTIIGPVRVEYGHNLNPRRGDPSGTVHFSLGFPF